MAEKVKKAEAGQQAGQTERAETVSDAELEKIYANMKDLAGECPKEMFPIFPSLQAWMEASHEDRMTMSRVVMLGKCMELNKRSGFVVMRTLQEEFPSC